MFTEARDALEKIEGMEGVQLAPFAGGHSAGVARVERLSSADAVTVGFAKVFARPPQMKAERAALEHLGARGFGGVPRVRYASAGRGGRTLILSPVGELGLDEWSRASGRDGERTTSLARDFGGWLASLHEVEVGVGEVRFSDDPLSWSDRLRAQSARAARRARELPEEPCALVLRALSCFEEELDALDLPPRPGRMIHRDLRLANVRVDGEGRFCGVIDFERAGAGDPAWDFAKLEWWVFDLEPSLRAPFVEGYSALRELPTEATCRLYRLFEAATMVAWFHGTHPIYPAESARQLEAELERRTRPRWVESPS